MRETKNPLHVFRPKRMCRKCRFCQSFALSTGPTQYEREWVRIKHSGPRMNRVSPGGRVELECEANGSPPPSVQWFHNNNPLSEVSSFIAEDMSKCHFLI